MNLKPPEPEQFGLTQESINYFKKAFSPKSFIITLIFTVVNFFVCLFIFDVVFPELHISFLIFLFLAFLPGFWAGELIGIKFDQYLTSKAKKRPDYLNFLKYQDALKTHQEALKATADIDRKLRWEEKRGKE